MERPVLVVIPVYGHHDMTHALLGDLRRERDLVDIVVVDNRGDYPALDDELVIRPGTNLGWAAGTNRGTIEYAAPHHVGFVWLNNDTRLGQHFIAGLLQAWEDTGAGLVGPFYDCHWRHQRVRHAVPVDHYRPRRVHYEAPFLDGTCLFVPAATVHNIGLLDAETFSPIGWGAEIDYSLRAAVAGLKLVTTRLSYLHHERSVTGKAVYAGGLQEYAERGYPVLMAGMIRKWGTQWYRRAGMLALNGQTPPPSWKRRARRPVGR